MMQSGLLSPEQILRKYGANGEALELHANEIVLLAYYIASVNIETAFQGATGSRYRPFDGICLTNSFALNENDDELEALFPDNSERRRRQRELDIRVIVGNPPWSVGQRKRGRQESQCKLSTPRRPRCGDLRGPVTGNTQAQPV